MTLSPFLVYLAMQMDDIKDALQIAGGFFLVIVIIIGFVRSNIYNEKEDSRLARIQKHCCISVFLCIALLGLLPGAKTIGAMVVLPAIAESEHLKALPDDVLAFLRALIHEYTPTSERSL
ncbi:hypothetical protein [Mailhella sp.]